MMASSPAQNKPKPDPFTLLPPIDISANCRTDSPKYNGTGDPACHVRTFRSYARLHAHDYALMAYLFQFTLEGEPQDWYHDLSPENLRDFEILADLFLERYRHYAAYTLTIT